VFTPNVKQYSEAASAENYEIQYIGFQVTFYSD